MPPFIFTYRTYCPMTALWLENALHAFSTVSVRLLPGTRKLRPLQRHLAHVPHQHRHLGPLGSLRYQTEPLLIACRVWRMAVLLSLRRLL